MEMISVSGTFFKTGSDSVYSGKRTGSHNKNLAGNKELNTKLRMLSKTELNSDFRCADMTQTVSVIDSTQSYGERIRIQRQKAQATALKLKKLKYRFKSLSAKIIRSKTSYAAKQAAGQARREALRLKNEKRKTEGDTTEIDAAIAHAKAMERVAKKKARHLEEEELIKVCQNEDFDKVYEAGKNPETELDEDFADEKETADDEAEPTIDELAKLMYKLEQKINSEYDDMGMEELTEAIMPPGKEMTPEEHKQLKTKHRNSEMREIVRADAEYLKSLFESLEKGKGDSNVVVTSSPGVVNVQPVSVSVDIGGAGVAVNMML